MSVVTGKELLAIDGGAPVRTAPMPPRLMIDQREVDAVAALMRRVATDGGSFDRYDGPEVDLLERELADYFGVRYVTCVSSGTAAVHAAIAALELDPGSEVICSSMTDPGGVMPLFMMGLIPVFVDHDVSTVLMSPASIERSITERTRAIIVTHLYGHVADMDAITGIARAHRLPVIGDASQAHAASHRGSLSGPFGDIGVVSTMAWKHMTTGGQGGFVATDDERLYWGAKRFADRGKPFGQDATSNTGIGLNYRMTELAATVGRVQLTKLADVAHRRRAIYEQLRDGLGGIPGVTAVALTDDTVPTPLACPFLIDDAMLGLDGTQFAAAVSAEGVAVNPGSRLIMYRKDFMTHEHSMGSSFFPFGYALPDRVASWQEPENPGIAELGRRLVDITPHEGWGEREVGDAIAAFRKVAGAHSRG